MGYYYILGCFCILIIIFLVFFLIVLYYRTTLYINYLKDCNVKTKFCYIKKINLNISNELIYRLQVLCENNGVRIELPQKAQKHVELKKIKENVPGIVKWYNDLPLIISEHIGEPVKTLPLEYPNSLSLIIYDKEGDFIDWHFDTNHYAGRYFTLLLPITNEKTCGNYQYKDENEEVRDVELKFGEALLFEGDKVFHRGKKLCKDEKRIILSMVFVTSTETNVFETILNKIKNYGMFGIV